MTYIAPRRPLEIDRAITQAVRRAPAQRTPRQRWLVKHASHSLEALDNHDYCYTCRSTFWRPTDHA